MILLEENLEELLAGSVECQAQDYGRNCPRVVEYRVFWKRTCDCAPYSDSSLVCGIHEVVIRYSNWQCTDCGSKIIILGTIKI